MKLFASSLERVKILTLSATLLSVALLSVATPACSSNANRTASNSAAETINSQSTSATASAVNTAVVVSAPDDSIFTNRIATAKAKGYQKLPIGERIVAMGKLFLGTPYVGGTLDVDSSQERLVLNLHGLDCVTFYENALALARVLGKYPTPTLKNYEDELTFLRYRDGKMDGFHSRLNYSTDYFRNNEKKGVLNILTPQIGGVYAVKDSDKIDFMTMHRAAYKQLAHNDSEYAAIAQTEKEINQEGGYYFIPKADIPKIESEIHTGDILGITTSLEGLDCSHTGIAVRLSDGRIHFMHASSLQKKVIISDEPLAEYLTHSSKQQGIVITRPLEVKSAKS